LKPSRSTLLPLLLSACLAAAPARAAAPKAQKLYVAVFDFASTPDKLGRQLADSVRVMLARHQGYDVLDKLTTRDAAASLPADADRKKVLALMTDQLAVHLAVHGTVRRRGGTVEADVRCVDLTDPKKPGGWKHVFSDDTERARGLISQQIVQTLRRRAEWAPPEYGDEPEPKPDELGRPLNVNGRFEHGHKGWDAPDNAATFLVAGPTGRGRVLKIRTDLERKTWMDYRRKLRFGLADPTRPPRIGRDRSYNSVAGMEGVDYRSEWIAATPGQRYWLLTDMKGKTAGIFFPKIFVKGYLDYSARATGLPEASLVERKITARQFAQRPEAERKKLVADDVKKHPERYRRECFRWYLSCRNEENVWKHYAAPFPPRGGLPANVRWFQITVYAYWPPGDYLFDNVLLYKDPRQKAPLPETKARTPKFRSGIQPQPK
jgi:TolB-like protein